MQERIRIDHGSFESALKKVEQWKVPREVKTEIYRFLDDLSLGKVNKGRRLSSLRQMKYLSALRVPLEFLRKRTRQLTLRDIEHFERAMGLGKLANKFNGKPYASSTQADIRMLLKIFLRWRLGPARASKLSGWLDTRFRPKTPDYLKESEVEQLYLKCRDAKQRFLIAVLFDSGARAEEFHNIRFEDVNLEEGEAALVKITLKQEYSKTEGRTISLFWNHSLAAVKEYLAERQCAGLAPGEPVFEGNYAATKKFLERLGRRVLKRRLYYHLFRHSSATHYASKMNRQQLCRRYGWKFSSNMPDVYISRSGMDTEELDEKFKQTKIETLNAKLTKLEETERIKDERDRIKDDRIRQLEESMHTMQQTLAKILRLNPTAEQVEAVLQRKQGQNKPQNKPEFTS